MPTPVLFIIAILLLVSQSHGWTGGMSWHLGLVLLAWALGLFDEATLRRRFPPYARWQERRTMK
jgi:hypothetical protein